MTLLFWSTYGWMFFGTLLISATLSILALWQAANSLETGPRTPLEIAKERYAAGEISRQELEEMRRALRKPAHFAG